VIWQRVSSVLGRRIVLLAVPLLAVAAAFGTTVAASASVHVPATPARSVGAYGCTQWGPIKIPVVNVTIPLGVYCFGINGSGTTVTSTYGHYYFLLGSLHGALYNETEVVRFYDNHGNNYQSIWEPVHLGWRYGDQWWTTNIHGTAYPGRVCASLVTNGAVMATVCEGIS